MFKPIKHIGIVVIAALAVAGCQSGGNAGNGGQATGGTAGSSPTPSADTGAAPEAVTLRFSWWGSEVRHQALLEAIDLYTKQHPHVAIEPEYGGFDGYYQKLVTQFAGGTAPDLTPLSIDWVNEIAVKGDLVYNLYDLQSHIDLDAFDKQFLEKYVVYDGKLVGLPMGANGMVTLYNKQFLERFDIPEDTVWDWQSIHEIGVRVHEQDPNAYLLGSLEYRAFLQPYVNQLSGNPWIRDDKTLGFGQEEAEAAFAYYRQLLEDGVVQPVEESSLYNDLTENPQWQNGNIGLMLTQASTIAKVKSFTPDVGVGSFPIPEGALTSAVLVNPSNPLAINKASKHPEEAAKFASWLLTSYEAAAILKDVYSVPAVAANAQRLAEENLIDPTVAKAVELALSNPGEPINALSSNQELNQLAQDILEQVAFRQLAPGQAAETLTTRLNEKLQAIQ